MFPTVLMLELKHKTKQSLPQKHQATVSHMPLLTMGIAVHMGQKLWKFSFLYI